MAGLIHPQIRLDYFGRRGHVRRMTPALSVVIPAFNEQDRLGPYLAEIRSYLDDVLTAAYEVIAVDDGSHDGTSGLVLGTAANWPQLRLLRHPANLGKGQAVRTGVRSSMGRRVLFTDADGATPIAEEARLSAALARGAVVAAGSRTLTEANVVRDRNWRRAVAGGLFARAARMSVGVTVTDTQCGFKMFDGPLGRDLFAESRETGYLLDVEILALAIRRGYPVVEVAVSWSERPGSKVRLVRDSCKMLLDLWRLRGRLRALPPIADSPAPRRVRPHESFRARASARKVTSSLALGLGKARNHIISLDVPTLTDRMVQSSSSLPRFAWAPWLLGGTLLLGAALRLIWGETIEFKEDEAWLFRLVSDHCIHGEWTPLGMPSSQHVRVPGLSVWVYYPLGHLFGVDEPTSLARGVQWSSIAALVGMVLFAWRYVPAAEREPWLWAAALLAVNPMAVLYHRKLWPPCMLPTFCMLFAFGWWYRDRRWGALIWGAVGACLGQIHATGFLFALAVLLTTITTARRGVRWTWWLVGSILGTLPMSRWLYYLVFERDSVGSNALEPHRWIEGKFWMHWITEPLGLDLRGVFGGDHANYLHWPIVGGHPTYAAAVAQVLAGLLGATIFAMAAKRWWDRRLVSAKPVPNSSALLVRAGFMVFGLLLTLTAVRFYRHYMIVTFPLMALWLTRLTLPDGGTDRERVLGRRLLAGLWAVNALNCVLMLTYLHANGGAPHGPFGPSYEAQVRDGGMRPPVIPLPE